MKKIIMVASLISIVSSNTFASDLGALENTNDGKTYFQVLEDMYNKGTKPDLKKISNIAWSGRCVAQDLPNEAFGGIGWAIRTKEDDIGPILSKIPNYEIFEHYNGGKPAAFDNSSFSELTKQSLYEHHFKDIEIKNSFLAFEEVFTNNYTTSQEFRMAGDYIVSQLKTNIHQVNLEKEEINIRCYFFKKNK